MKLWIIYNKIHETVATYSPQIMLDEAKNCALDAEVFFCEYFNVVVENGIEKLFYKGKKVNSYPDVAFFRCYDFDLMSIFEKKGIKLVNSIDGMMSSRDKYLSYLLANKYKIDMPAVVHTNDYNYDTLSQFLGDIFVMKDRFGSQGKGVYLIHNQDDIDNAKGTADSFVFQQYIEKSSGRDIRLYVVGDRIISAIERFSTSGDFRSNIYLGGDSRETTVPDEIKEQSIKLSKAMGLNICSVDYLFDGEKYKLCEVNGNASLSIFIKANYKMQRIFMDYISRIKYINYWSRLKDLQYNEMDYVCEDVGSKIVLSAPHAVPQVRDGKIKSKDLGSGELALKLAKENSLSYIIKAKNNGNDSKNDDANFYDCSYKDKLLGIVSSGNFVIDIHSLSSERSQQIVLGTNGMKNIDDDTNLLSQIISCFTSKGLNVEVDTIFSAGEKTVSSKVHDCNGTKSIQVEINSSLINPLNKDNKINLISSAFQEIFDIINTKSIRL